MIMKIVKARNTINSDVDETGVLQIKFEPTERKGEQD
jgi:hypothetical protein